MKITEIVVIKITYTLKSITLSVLSLAWINRRLPFGWTSRWFIGIPLRSFCNMSCKEYWTQNCQCTIEYSIFKITTLGKSIMKWKCVTLFQVTHHTWISVAKLPTNCNCKLALNIIRAQRIYYYSEEQWAKNWKLEKTWDAGQMVEPRGRWRLDFWKYKV